MLEKGRTLKSPCTSENLSIAPFPYYLPFLIQTADSLRSSSPEPLQTGHLRGTSGL